jgi:hypothetical protein
MENIACLKNIFCTSQVDRSAATMRVRDWGDGYGVVTRHRPVETPHDAWHGTHFADMWYHAKADLNLIDKNIAAIP